MGSFNSNYESYYSGLKQGQNKSMVIKYSRNSGDKNDKRPKSSFFVRRIIQELAGVLCLFIIITACKLIDTKATRMVLSYSKEIVEESYDFNKIAATAKSLSITDLTDELEDYIEDIKTKITGEQGLKARTTESFINPVEGTIIKKYGESLEGFSQKAVNGLLISFKAPTEIVSCYEGTVKEIGEHKELGQYVVINHGEAIETKYYYLEEVMVQENASVKKGDAIGKIYSANAEGHGYLYFQLLHMGVEENPEEYLTFNIE